MNTEEVDFSHLHCFSTDCHVNFNGGDKSNELAITTNSDDPLGWLARWVQGPAQKWNRVVEAELAIGVLYVMVCKQLVNFFRSLVIVEIEGLPRVLFGQRHRLCFNLVDTFLLEWFVICALRLEFRIVRNRLSVPQLVDFE